MRMRRLSLNPVCASLCTTMANLSQFFPEIQNRIVYEHAQEQTCPKFQPYGRVRAPQCPTCHNYFLKTEQMFDAHAQEQTCPTIQPRGPLRTPQ
jgi:hypothetical protein